MIKKLAILVLLILLLVGCSKKDIYQAMREANYQNDVYYQIFVRSFADSDGDGTGDFRGIIDKLDYLEKLGITALWLMPIHPSPTYHGYDVIDYYDVNPDYGTLDDFRNLVAAAREKGIKIMLDMVLNHSSSQHPWFLAALDGEEKYLDYYNFTDSLDGRPLTGSWGQNIWHHCQNKYYCGYFSDTMPDFNLLNEDLIEEIYNICRFWIDIGVGGFRLDAANHFFGLNEYSHKKYDYFDNIRFTKELRKEIKKYDSDFYLVGEIVEAAETIIRDYYFGLDAPLDYPVANRLRTAAAKNGDLYYVKNIMRIYDAYSEIKADFISAPFLTNHDLDRMASVLGANTDKMKLAAEMHLVLPGSPIIYYGEELGMFGTKANGELADGIAVWDETRRLPLPFGDNYETTWFNNNNFSDVRLNAELAPVSMQIDDPDSLWNTYSSLIAVRKANPALCYGNRLSEYEDNSYGVQGFYRSYRFQNYYQKVLVIHNLSADEVALSVPGKVIYLSGTSDYNNVASLPAKSTVIIDVTGVSDD